MSMQDIYARLAALAAAKSTESEQPRIARQAATIKRVVPMQDATPEEIAAFEDWRAEDATWNPFFAIHETIRTKRTRRGLLPETPEEIAQERVAMWFTYQRLHKIR